MHRSEGTIRALKGVELEAAMAVHAEITGNLDPSGKARTERRFDRVRVAALTGSIDYYDIELRAIAAGHAAVGGGPILIRWYGAHSEIGPTGPSDGVVETTAEELVRIAELDEPDDALAGLEPDARAGLQNFMSMEWSIFAANGRWMASSRDVEDFYLLGGSEDFMGGYLAVRPAAPDDVLTWLSSTGYLFTNHTLVRRIARPRTPRFLRGVLDREEYEDRFDGSFTARLLERLYGAGVAGELWGLHLEMEDLANSLVGDAWKELAMLKERRPELEARLREIWDGP